MKRLYHTATLEVVGVQDGERIGFCRDIPIPSITYLRDDGQVVNISGPINIYAEVSYEANRPSAPLPRVPYPDALLDALEDIEWIAGNVLDRFTAKELRTEGLPRYARREMVRCAAAAIIAIRHIDEIIAADLDDDGIVVEDTA